MSGKKVNTKNHTKNAPTTPSLLQCIPLTMSRARKPEEAQNHPPLRFLRSVAKRERGKELKNARRRPSRTDHKYSRCYLPFPHCLTTNPHTTRLAAALSGPQSQGAGCPLPDLSHFHFFSPPVWSKIAALFLWLCGRGVCGAEGCVS